MPVRAGLHIIIMTSQRPRQNGDFHTGPGNSHLLKLIAILDEYSKRLVLTEELNRMITRESASPFTHPN